MKYANNADKFKCNMEIQNWNRWTQYSMHYALM